jgi:hypothetical protein|tara:strand:+ start:541 stop:984 length:444 start_codon:yes stop_codon:yes gene_type:complete
MRAETVRGMDRQRAPSYANGKPRFNKKTALRERIPRVTSFLLTAPWRRWKTWYEGYPGFVCTRKGDRDDPRGNLLILTNASGGQLTEHRASEGLRQWREKAGLNRDLCLYDCRGTSATRLLDAGLSLSEIANHIGWSIRTAANVIEH